MKKIIIPKEEDTTVSILHTNVNEGIILKHNEKPITGLVRYDAFQKNDENAWDIVFSNGADSDYSYDSLKELMESMECKDYTFYQL